jgi:DNA-binding response OmpR family regulator
MTPAPPGGRRDEPDSASESPFDTLSILVVEADRATAELARTLLNREPGWGATVARDAAAARAVCRHMRIDLLVVNAELPGISGLELLDLLRREPGWHDPPVVLTTANGEQPELREALSHGTVARLIPKPFGVGELLAAVHAVRRVGP